MKRILIVDDERSSRQLLDLMLRSDGFLIEMAEGGEEALAMIAAQPPDLVLLDVMMPRMDGYQVAAAIRANPATSHVPVVMISGTDDGRPPAPGAHGPASDFLTKPVDRAELCRLVGALLAD